MTLTVFACSRLPRDLEMGSPPWSYMYSPPWSQESCRGSLLRLVVVADRNHPGFAYVNTSSLGLDGPFTRHGWARPYSSMNHGPGKPSLCLVSPFFHSRRSPRQRSHYVARQ